MSTVVPPTPAGLVLEPFRALRFVHKVDDSDVLAPPSDELSPAEARALRQRSLHSTLRLTRPDGAGTARYAAAAQQLREWRTDGTLRQDDVPALYVYEIIAPGRQGVRGMLGAVRLAPATAGIVMPHEDTMSGPVADRLDLLAATETDLEPIFLVYDGGQVAADAMAAALAGSLLMDAVTPDGVRHRLAKITEPEMLGAIAAEVLPRRALIADGHHRYQTYLAHQRRHWNAGDGPGPWDAGLAFLVDASRAGPEVRAIHRVLNDIGIDRAVELVSRAGTVQELADLDGPALLRALAVCPQHQPAFVLAGAHRAVLWTGLDEKAVAAARPLNHKAAWGSLDVSILHSYVIPRVLGLSDDEQAVRFYPDAGKALAVAGQLGGTAVLLRAATATEVLLVAADGDRMPRKSTLFTPKPASGMVLRPLARERA